MRRRETSNYKICRSPKISIKNPLFSIFLKDYIEHKYSITALQSIVNQTIDVDDYEIIVLTDRDDISEYKQIMNEHDNNYIIIITGLVNLGESYNVFLEYATGLYACPIDNDDSWSNNRLELIRNIIFNNTNIGFIKNEVSIISERKNDFYTKIKYWIKMNIPIKTSNKIYLIEESTDKKILGRSLAHNVSSMVIKMCILKEKRDMIKDINTHDDPYLFFFVSYSNQKMIFMDIPLSNYLIRTNSLTTRNKEKSNILEMRQEYTRFVRIFGNQFRNNRNKNYPYNLFLLYKLTLELLINMQRSKTVNIKNSELNAGLKQALKYRMHNFIFLFLATKVRNRY